MVHKPMTKFAGLVQVQWPAHSHQQVLHDGLINHQSYADGSDVRDRCLEDYAHVHVGWGCGNEITPPHQSADAHQYAGTRWRCW